MEQNNKLVDFTFPEKSCNTAFDRLKALSLGKTIFVKIVYLGDQSSQLFDYTSIGSYYENTKIRCFPDGFEFLVGPGRAALFVASLKTCFYYDI
jgi:hypothetical protein